MISLPTALLATLPLALAAHPPKAAYPGVTYPDAKVAYAVAGAKSNQTSPPKYPSPWGEGLGDWADAYAKAKAFVSQITLTEKVNLTTGVGWESEK